MFPECGYPRSWIIRAVGPQIWASYGFVWAMRQEKRVSQEPGPEAKEKADEARGPCSGVAAWLDQIARGVGAGVLLSA